MKNCKMPRITELYGTYRKCISVEVGDMTFYFSYDTCVAYWAPGEGLVISENVWSMTTGRHLNIINDDKKIRIPYNEFEKKLQNALIRHNLVEMTEEDVPGQLKEHFSQ